MEKVTEPMNKNEAIALLVRLIQETQERRIDWRKLDSVPKAVDEENEQFVSPVFEAQYRGSTLRLYKKRIKPTPKLFDKFRLTSPDLREQLGEEEVVLQVLSTDGASTQPLAGIRALEDLLSAVQIYLQKVNLSADRQRDLDEEPVEMKSERIETLYSSLAEPQNLELLLEVLDSLKEEAEANQRETDTIGERIDEKLSDLRQKLAA